MQKVNDPLGIRSDQTWEIVKLFTENGSPLNKERPYDLDEYCRDLLLTGLYQQQALHDRQASLVRYWVEFYRLFGDDPVTQEWLALILSGPVTVPEWGLYYVLIVALSPLAEFLRLIKSSGLALPTLDETRQCLCALSAGHVLPRLAHWTEELAEGQRAYLRQFMANQLKKAPAVADCLLTGHLHIQDPLLKPWLTLRQRYFTSYMPQFAVFIYTLRYVACATTDTAFCERIGQCLEETPLEMAQRFIYEGGFRLKLPEYQEKPLCLERLRTALRTARERSDRAEAQEASKRQARRKKVKNTVAP